nr:MAG TPA: hypothetical protein [Caudoviricetes sp.]
MYYGRSGSVVHICAAFPGIFRTVKGVIDKEKIEKCNMF